MRPPWDKSNADSWAALNQVYYRPEVFRERWIMTRRSPTSAAVDPMARKQRFGSLTAPDRDARLLP
jgi:hypothetical protein